MVTLVIGACFFGLVALVCAVGIAVQIWTHWKQMRGDEKGEK